MTKETLGVFFKHARETQGFSLDKASSLTRIQPKFLKALEEENFAALPEQVYVRGFVQTYARALGIDEADALRRFSEDSGTYYQKGKEERHQALLQREEERRGKFNRNLVVLITVIILIGLWFLLPEKQEVSPPATITEKSTASSSPHTGQTNGNTKSLEILKQSAEKSEKSSPTTSPPPKASSPEAPVLSTPTPEQPSATGMGGGPSPLVLELEATELTWIVVQSDKKDPHEALLQPGERMTWEASTQFILTLGNAGGVQVKLNGEVRGPFGKPGDVVRDIVVAP